MSFARGVSIDSEGRPADGPHGRILVLCFAESGGVTLSVWEEGRPTRLARVALADSDAKRLAQDLEISVRVARRQREGIDNA